MKAHPFALLTAVGKDNRPVATQIPLFADAGAGKILLSGHIMRKTDHHLALSDNPEALVVFTGPHAFVSASWYAGPRMASTWNYMSVHARGRIRFCDEAYLYHLLKRLTDHFLPGPGEGFSSLSEDYVQDQMKTIVAFEMEVYELEGIFKLSQNRDQHSYQSIIGHLESGDNQAKAVAVEMRKKRGM